MITSAILRLVHYPGSGNYIVADPGVKVCRYDSGILYFWHGKRGAEIPITLAELQRFMAQTPTLTASPRREDGSRS